MFVVVVRCCLLLVSWVVVVCCLLFFLLGGASCAVCVAVRCSRFVVCCGLMSVGFTCLQNSLLSHVVCCSVCVVRGLLFVCLFSVVVCWLIVVVWFALFVVFGLLLIGLFQVCLLLLCGCLLCAVCRRSLFAVRWLLFVVCCRWL